MAKTKQKSKPANKKPAPKSAARAKAKKPVKPAPKKPVKDAPAKRKTKPAKPAPKSKSTQKRKPPPPPGVPEQVLSGDSLAFLAADLRDALGDDDSDVFFPPTIAEVAGRDAIHVELGAKLAAMRGDEVQERAAIASAIDSYMRLAIADGLAPDASAYSARCPEFFWEGDAMNPPVYARVPDATHDEIGRWFQLIVEGVRAYDARVGAVAPN
ncbi:MAG TPA: hypothetical protein VIV40_04735 [Kofleriaceae bacterium]